LNPRKWLEIFFLISGDQHAIPCSALAAISTKSAASQKQQMTSSCPVATFCH